MTTLAAAYSAMQDGAAFLCPPPHIDADDLLTGIPDGHLGVFTSGSTGTPRCIVRTWASWQDSFAIVDERLAVRPGELVGLAGPLWSTMILFAALHALQSDAIPHVDLDPGSGDAADVVHAVPAAALDLLDAIEEGLRAAPRLLVTAGAAAPRRLWERAAAAGIDMVEYVGSAETSFIAWRSDPGSFDLVPGVDIEIRDGVIWVRSPYAATGYLGDAGGPLRRDGEWISVGDHGAFDPDSGLQMQGRGDDAVTTAGHTVLVAEVEAALTDVPGVDQLAVVGVPHERYGQILVAVYTGTASAAVLRAAAHTLPPAARPRAWVHRETLPRLRGGKLDRAAISEVARP